MMTQKIKIVTPLLIGVLAFWLVVGFSAFSPQNLGWLSKGDLLFNYVGWEIFRYGPWTNPLGLNPHYGLDFSSSIVYSDSIPLLAVLFKLFSVALGNPFQYFGLWLFICFVLQGFFGFKLGELLTSNYWQQLLIATVFLFTPVMLFRVNIHLALAGHFVILWALYLNLRKRSDWWSWPLLIVISLGIHFYLFVMVFGLWLACLLDKDGPMHHWKIKPFAQEVLLVFVPLLLSAWQYGYFAISTGASLAIGYGGDPLNLLGFFNPLGWSLFVGKNLFQPPTIEGFAYAGLGVLALFLLGLLQALFPQVRRPFLKKLMQHRFLALAAIIMLLIAITHHIDIGNTSFRLNLNQALLDIFSIVRSASRLSWVFQYLLIYATCWLMLHGRIKRVTLVLFALCVLQIFDTSKGWRQIHTYFATLNGSKIEYPLSHEFWTQIPRQYSAIKVVTPYWPQWRTFAVYAAQHQMATDSVYLARVDNAKLQAAMVRTDEELRNNALDPKTLYVFQDWKFSPYHAKPSPNLRTDLFARIDGFVVLAPNYKNCTQCLPIDPRMEIISLIPSITLGVWIDFSRKGLGREFLMEGWSHPEDWGVWSSGSLSTIAIPINGNGAKSIGLQFRALVTEKHPRSEVQILLNSEVIKTIALTKQNHNLEWIDIPRRLQNEPYIVLKFEYLNPVSPVQAGYGNNDNRLLTIGLESMVLKK